MTDAELIDRLGGPSRVAELMGIERQGGAQRVCNWKTRGIPPRVKLEHPHLFLVPMPARPASSDKCKAA